MLIEHMQLISRNDLEETSASKLLNSFESSVKDQIDVVRMSKNIMLLDAYRSVSTRLNNQDSSSVLR